MPYSGRATRTGNSRGFRFESALFASHPEFEHGEVEADVIAPGRLLVRTRVSEAENEADPVLDAFLAFVAEQMRTAPDQIRPLTSRDLAGLDDLLAGVEYDPAEEVPEDFELP